MKSMHEKWLVFYTKSRHEEKVKELLERNGFQVFLPMQQIIRQWSDRKKKMMVPLFNSYIFVFETESSIQEIVQTPGISWNVRHNGKPAVLHQEEYDMINRFLATGLFVETMMEKDLKEGDYVEVAGGSLKGIKGRLVTTPDGDKFSVTLSVLGNSMMVKLDSRLIKRDKSHFNE